MAGLGLLAQKMYSNRNRRNHVRHFRLQNLYQPQKNGLLNRLLEEVSFSVLTRFLYMQHGEWGSGVTTAGLGPKNAFV
jgi:hypothetical protein